MAGENCSANCPTRNCKNFGDCLRSKSVGAIGYKESKGECSGKGRITTEMELDLYRSAVQQGIEPASTGYQAVQDSIIISNEVGAAYGVDFAQATPMGDTNVC